ncbi:MAG: depupylase/deamidase Dop [Winkia neuii]|uniref:depupylase/deamidase Dop n=1 Tax=Winkia neuii TaxID=33007 RepID=UPI0028FDE74C|nr:depupylase/deamidase Dop [Winkia neuii]MDU3134859.1 depupylase/deamidase Dop [Winkia neuii]
MRLIGTETEYGVTDPDDVSAGAIALSALAVSAYGNTMKVAPGWDYAGEDPLNDMRGHRLDRASAHPSQLTDDPAHPAPSGDIEYLARPTRQEALLPSLPAVVIENGGRLYVDHAHPEYSSPEASSALGAVLYDRAAEAVAARAIQSAQDHGRSLALYKNNVDGKGASYGAHENYSLSRQVPFEDVIEVLLPHLVTRQILCGAGRVGRGQRSSSAGFQISQRADYIENDVGLETTFNRPLINTRDEPHANADRWRRLHVIVGDANMFDYSIYLKVGTVDLLLTYLESGGGGLELDAIGIVGDPVPYVSAVSHNLSLDMRIPVRSGAELNPVEHQLTIAELVGDSLSKRGLLVDERKRVHEVWTETLEDLRRERKLAARRIEWVAKYNLLEAMRSRRGVGWDDPVLAAMDLQWSDLRPGMSLAHKLGSRVDRIFSPAQVQQASMAAPADTRAALRGAAVKFLPQLQKASWTTLVLDPGGKNLVRLRLPEPEEPVAEDVQRAAEAGDLDLFIRQMIGEH